MVNCDTWMNVHLREVICTSKDGDRFWRIPECYIRGNTVKYMRVQEEVMDKAVEDQKKFRKHGQGRGGARQRRPGKGEPELQGQGRVWRQGGIQGQQQQMSLAGGEHCFFLPFFLVSATRRRRRRSAIKVESASLSFFSVTRIITTTSRPRSVSPAPVSLTLKRASPSPCPPQTRCCAGRTE